MSFCVAVESCENAATAFETGRAIKALKMRPVALAMMGDDPYFNTQMQWLTQLIASVSINSTQQEIADRVRLMFRKPGWSDLLELRALGMKILCLLFDDHRGADSWDHTLAAALTGGAPLFTASTTPTHLTATQADMDVFAKRWYAAIRSLGNELWDRPTAAEMNAPAPDLPSGAPALVGSDIINGSFYIDYDRNGVEGGRHARLLCPDLISGRSPYTATDNASKVMLGTNTRAWLVTRAKEAWDQGFMHVLMMSTKRLHIGDVAGRYGNGFNTDTFGNYSVHRDGLMQELWDYGVRMPVVSADRHSPIIVARGAAQGQAYDSLDFSACPSGVEHNASGERRTYGQRWQRCFADSKFHNNFGLLTFNDDDTLSMDIMHSRVVQGEVSRWTGVTVGPRSVLPIEPVSAARLV